VGQQGEGSGAARVGIRNIRPIRPERPNAVVILGEHGIPRDGGGQLKAWHVGMVRRHQEALDILGLETIAMADTDIATRGVPEGVKLVSCPMSPAVPDGMCDALSDFMARGGKVLWSHWIPPAAKECLARHPEASTNVVNSLDKDDNRHVFAYANRLRPVVEKLVPELSGRIDRAIASRKKAEKGLVAEIRAIPPVAGEERVLDCHAPYGPWPDDGGLARTAKFAKDCGFTALDVNVCQGATAWYESKVLRRSGDVSVRGDAVKQLVGACRENGLKAVAWRGDCCGESARRGEADRGDPPPGVQNVLLLLLVPRYSSDSGTACTGSAETVQSGPPWGLHGGCIPMILGWSPWPGRSSVRSGVRCAWMERINNLKPAKGNRHDCLHSTICGDHNDRDRADGRNKDR